MSNNIVADISAFESLQNQAHKDMGMPQSQMAAFNATADQERALKEIMKYHKPKLEAKFKEIKDSKAKLESERQSTVSASLGFLAMLDLLEERV